MTKEIKPGSIYFNNPGELNHVVLKDVKALYMTTLSESFLKQYVHLDIFEEFPFLLAAIVPPKIFKKKINLPNWNCCINN